MKQSPIDMLIFGSALAIVLGLTVALSTTPGIQPRSSHASGMPSTAFSQAYQGPSTNYAVTPDTEILTYDEPGHDFEKPGDFVEAYNSGEAQLTAAPG